MRMMQVHGLQRARETKSGKGENLLELVLYLLTLRFIPLLTPSKPCQ